MLDLRDRHANPACRFVVPEDELRFGGPLRRDSALLFTLLVMPWLDNIVELRRESIFLLAHGLPPA